MCYYLKVTEQIDIDKRETFRIGFHLDQPHDWGPAVEREVKRTIYLKKYSNY